MIYFKKKEKNYFSLFMSNIIGKKLDELDLLARYDMVIHLESSACSSGYSLENNKARYESVEEAVLLDKRTVNAWATHNNLHIVKSADNFIDKVNMVRTLIYKCVEDNQTCKKKKREI